MKMRGMVLWPSVVNVVVLALALGVVAQPDAQLLLCDALPGVVVDSSETGTNP